MRIDALEVTNFRNIKTALIRPGTGVNIFFGDNGSGKSNLLEAIFALCLGRSQRGGRDLMMIGEGADEVFHLEGVGHVEGREVRLTCAYQRGGRKKITIDGNPARTSRLFQIFSLISMAPEDVALFAGSPSVRRQFLDLHLSQASPSYLADLSDYSKALAQKNSFLKVTPDDDCPFDPLLIDCGSRIIAARQRFITFLKTQASAFYRDISDGDRPEGRMALDFQYRPNVSTPEAGDISRSFQAKLNAYRHKEALLQTALVGPHRDDIEFTIGGFPARGYGSQGELRSGAVAIMMAAAKFLEDRRREKPILLLDEIFAELDDHRRDNLARLFGSFDQIFLTTAVAPPQALMEHAVLFHIRQGVVTRE